MNFKSVDGGLKGFSSTADIQLGATVILQVIEVIYRVLRKYCPNGKLRFFLESEYSIKAWQSEERVNGATMLVQYTS